MPSHSSHARPCGLEPARFHLSMGFSRQEYWSGLPWPSPGDLPDPGIEPRSLASLGLTGGFFTTRATWKPLLCRLVPPKGWKASTLQTQRICSSDLPSSGPQMWINSFLSFCLTVSGSVSLVHRPRLAGPKGMLVTQKHFLK